MDWASIGVGIGGFAAAIAVIAPLLWRPIRHLLHHSIGQGVAKAVDQLKTDIDSRFDANDHATQQVRDEVLKIKAQFSPNGGSSMADRMTQLSVEVGQLRGAFREHTREHHK